MDDIFSTGGSSQPPPPPPPPGGYDPTGGSQGGFGYAPQPPLPPVTGGFSPPTPGAGMPPPPPPPPSKPANFQLGALLPAVLKVRVPVHTLKFDEQYFLHLLAGSISLTKDEKARIIESIPKLKQSQVDELVRIFEEERRKFAELGQEHVPQLEKLAKQHFDDWVDIEMRQEQTSKSDEDAKKAEEIRKQLGL